MRVDDLALPPLDPHPIPPDAPIADWPVELRIGIQRDDGEPVLWDDGHLWGDTTDPRLVWDGAATDPVWVDAVCDFHELVIDNGRPDELGLYPTTELVALLANKTGAWSTWTAAGRAAAFPIGTPLAVWATVDGDDRWLFSGRVAVWRQVGDTVTVVAYDGVADLAADWGAPWTPGAAGQRPLPRIAAIAAGAGWPGVVDGDTGHTDLLTSEVDGGVSPWEAMQTAALSDGGIVAGDVDGRILYRDRHWRDGRADQPTVAVFTDNACDADAHVVWDADTGRDDTAVATEIRLTNTAGVTVVATTGNPRPVRLTHPNRDWWPAGDGQDLADWLLEYAKVAGYRVDSFALHLGDPNQPALWDVATGLRRGDRIAWLTDTYDAAQQPVRVDVDVIVAGVRHDITPATWITAVYGTRAVAARTLWLWDAGHLWDDPNPDNVWRP